jgi:hypothetical protein
MLKVLIERELWRANATPVWLTAILVMRRGSLSTPELRDTHNDLSCCGSEVTDPEHSSDTVPSKYSSFVGSCYLSATFVSFEIILRARISLEHAGRNCAPYTLFNLRYNFLYIAVLRVTTPYNLVVGSFGGIWCFRLYLYSEDVGFSAT